ncbi:MAG: MFS transporter [Anaerolineales bacterium]|nr:MFS transporter [Anaerolineales bacterium]
MALGIFTNSVFLPLTGLFFSIIFPTLTAAASDATHENVNTILGVLFTFSGLGGVVGPWLVAWSSQYFGLQVGFIAILLLTVLTSVFIFILNQRSTYESNS